MSLKFVKVSLDDGTDNTYSYIVGGDTDVRVRNVVEVPVRSVNLFGVVKDVTEDLSEAAEGFDVSSAVYFKPIVRVLSQDEARAWKQVRKARRRHKDAMASFELALQIAEEEREAAQIEANLDAVANLTGVQDWQPTRQILVARRVVTDPYADDYVRSPVHSSGDYAEYE